MSKKNTPPASSKTTPPAVQPPANNTPPPPAEPMVGANDLREPQQPKNNVLPLAVVAFLLVVLSFFAYQPALDNEFVDWDDYTYVIENELVTSEKVPVSQIFKRPISLNYHPLTIWSMRLNNNKCASCLDGISAEPFIRWNVIIHLVNVLLVFGLSYYLSRRNWLFAAALALWWAVHPMRVESVVWVSERKDVLYTMFFLLAMATYLRYLFVQRLGWLAATLVLFVLAILSKAMAVVLPVVMVLLAFWQHPSASGWESVRAAFAPRRLLEYVPFFALALFFGLMAVKIQSGQNFMGLLEVSKNTPVAINDFGTFKISERFHFAAHGYGNYITKFFVPTDLCTFYPYPTRPNYEASSGYYTGILVLMIASLAAAVWFAFAGKRQWQKMYVFGIGFYFITVALVLQFLSVGLVIAADRYTYLPHIGLAFSLFMPLTLLPKQGQQIAFGVLIALGLIFVPMTRTQSDTWQNSESLWTQVIKTQSHTGNIDHAYSVRGHSFGKTADKLMQKGKRPEAEALLQKAFADFEAAVKLGTQKCEVYEGLGNIYGMRGNYAEALKYFTKAVEIDPKRSSIHFNIGVTYAIQNQWAQAADAYDRADSIGFDRMRDLRSNRAIARINATRYADAIVDLRWLIQQEPSVYNHYTNLGIAQQLLGDKTSARAAFQQALQLNPQDPISLQKLQELGAQ